MSAEEREREEKLKRERAALARRSAWSRATSRSKASHNLVPSTECGLNTKVFKQRSTPRIRIKVRRAKLSPSLCLKQALFRNTKRCSSNKGSRMRGPSICWAGRGRRSGYCRDYTLEIRQRVGAKGRAFPPARARPTLIRRRRAFRCTPVVSAALSIAGQKDSLIVPDARSGNCPFRPSTFDNASVKITSSSAEPNVLREILRSRPKEEKPTALTPSRSAICFG